LSESELVRRAQSGEQEAFCTLVVMHQRRLYALALYLFRNAGDAEEFSQEDWFRAWRDIRHFRSDGAFYAWVRRIQVSLFLNEQRRRERHPEGTCHNDVIEIPSGPAVARMQNAVLLREVAEALGSLSRQQRAVFSLRYSEGMSITEIAAEVGCSSGTVKKALFRAIQKLREKLGCITAAVPG
jgi:RNA polymerase sigma-70 factor, ECF subfamily